MNRIVILLLLLFFWSGSTVSVDCKNAKPSTKPASKATAHKQSSAGGSAEEIRTGKNLYKVHDCASCHSINGEGCKDGMPLDHVGSKRSEKFLYDQLSDPETHVSKNPKAFGGDPVNLMPAPDLEPKQIKPLVKYLKTLK